MKSMTLEELSRHVRRQQMEQAHDYMDMNQRQRMNSASSTYSRAATSPGKMILSTRYCHSLVQKKNMWSNLYATVKLHLIRKSDKNYFALFKKKSKDQKSILKNPEKSTMKEAQTSKLRTAFLFKGYCTWVKRALNEAETLPEFKIQFKSGSRKIYFKTNNFRLISLITLLFILLSFVHGDFFWLTS